jgi:hypothetical protein
MRQWQANRLFSSGVTAGVEDSSNDLQSANHIVSEVLYGLLCPWCLWGAKKEYFGLVAELIKLLIYIDDSNSD